MFVKVCGLTSREQVDWAVDLGYSAIGVVLHPPSARYREQENARDLARHAGNRILRVAVGVSFDEVAPVYDDFDYIQLYEYKKSDKLILSGTQLPARDDYAYFLYDASRGSGKFEHYPEWPAALKNKLIISGGFNEHNISGIIREYRPFGVDVSSGVEKTRGIKDYTLMKNFITEVKNCVK